MDIYNARIWFIKFLKISIMTKVTSSSSEYLCDGHENMPNEDSLIPRVFEAFDMIARLKTKNNLTRDLDKSEGKKTQKGSYLSQIFYLVENVQHGTCFFYDILTLTRDAFGT